MKFILSAALLLQLLLASTAHAATVRQLDARVVDGVADRYAAGLLHQTLFDTYPTATWTRHAHRALRRHAECFYTLCR